MDHYDRERYISIYTMLAELLERERGSDPEEHHLSFILGGLTRRVFVDAGYLPPDELLEETAFLLRSGDQQQLPNMARRLREHADHLRALDSESGGETN